MLQLLGNIKNISFLLFLVSVTSRFGLEEPSPIEVEADTQTCKEKLAMVIPHILISVSKFHDC